jgi:hypothetical protein
MLKYENNVININCIPHLLSSRDASSNLDKVFTATEGVPKNTILFFFFVFPHSMFCCDRVMLSLHNLRRPFPALTRTTKQPDTLLRVTSCANMIYTIIPFILDTSLLQHCCTTMLYCKYWTTSTLSIMTALTSLHYCTVLHCTVL